MKHFRAGRAHVSLVANLKKFWHLLPQEWRYEIASSTRHFSEPILAAALPKAQCEFNLPTSHVLVIGLFSSAIGHGSAANLLVTELRSSGI